MKDFFVSYTGTDIEYATWVAKVLEDANYSVTIQAWDFRPGDDFVSKINTALIECNKLIIILSKEYLKSEWCEAEWTSKLTQQIKLKEQLIIPIRIEPVELQGLLSPIIYIDIVDKSESHAKEEILSGVREDVLREAVNDYPSYYNLEYAEIDIDYYVEKSRIVYVKACKGRILIGGKNAIHNRIPWFADEDISLVSLTEGIEIEYLDLHDTNLNYNIVFDHLLEKGDIVEYRIKAILSNNNKHFKNFFSTEIITPIKNLSIHLNLGDTSVKRVYTQKLSTSPMNKRTEPPMQHAFDSPYHWSIHNPELNFEYKIYW